MNSTSSPIVRAAIAAVLVLCSAHGAWAQLNEHCTVSVLNRTAQVNPDGSWVLPNIPAGTGQVKARATCVEDGATRSGESEFFTVTPNVMNAIPPIEFGTTTPIPSGLVIAPATTRLTSTGQTLQLAVTATYPDDSTRDVTAARAGTNYTISNPAVATVTADGLVTAQASGVVVIQANNDGAPAIAMITVVLSNGDSDQDGIPDDYEVAHGLNPNDAIDAGEDPDHDGLTNLQEYQLGTDPHKADTDGDGLTDSAEITLGTNPLLRDTDGDGIPDGVEVQTGTNPLDPTSLNLATALRSLAVAPPAFTLTFNTVGGDVFRQLTVTGTLLDGSTIDLTSSARGTDYNSSDLTICNFGGVDGRVFAGTDGTCTITVRTATFTTIATGTVRTFSPKALSSISIPGYANNVDVNGNLAFVAAGAAGLQIVDVSNPAAPFIAGAVATPGNANDVRVVGDFAYVADGVAGLEIVDATNPASPVIVGRLDTAGEANDVVVEGSLAYVADGPAGLQIIDVSDPAAPLLIRTVDTPGTARGVDVAGTTAVVADDVPDAGLRVIDVSNPAAAQIVGSVALDGQPTDVSLSSVHAVVADYSGGVRIVNISQPSAPVVEGSLPENPPQGFVPRDVQTAGPFAIFAEQIYANAVAPIVDISNPAAPQVKGLVDFGQDYAGTGIAVSGPYVYWTGQSFVVSAENGSTGTTRLFIGQYIGLEDVFDIPPTISMTTSANGAPIIEGSTLTVKATATDDVAVSAVRFFVNGQPVFTDTSQPYSYTFTVPIGVSSVVVGAQASDFGDNTSVADDIAVAVIPDPLTTVTGRVVDSTRQPLGGANVSVLGHTGVTAVDGTFSISGVPTIARAVVASASVTRDGAILRGSSPPTAPVRGGTTNVGDIAVSATTFENDLGRLVPRCDNCTITVPIPFAFPISGTTYQQVRISSGYVAFDGGAEMDPFCCDISTNPSDPESGLYINDQLADRFVVTWFKQLTFGSGQNPTTVQLILFADGRVQYGYHGVATSASPFVAIYPDHATSDREVDFSADTTLNTIAGEGLFESFDAESRPFDLDGGFLVFTPNAAGGFGVLPVPDTVGPVCSVTNPPNDATLFIGETLVVQANATDNGLVRHVAFRSSDGSLNTDDSSSPFAASFAVPAGVNQITFTATAYDGWENAGACTSTVNVIAGPPPTVAITSPAAGTALTEGATIPITVDAANRVPVGRVDLIVNGVTVATDNSMPFGFLFTVPAGVTSLALSATAVDTVGKAGTSPIVNLPVTPDPLTTVAGIVVDRSSTPASGAQVVVEPASGTSVEIFNFTTPLATLPDLAGKTPDKVTVISAVNLRNPSRVFGADPFGFGSAVGHAARLSANLRIAAAGTYNFTLGVSDGGRLIVNGTTVVDLPNATGQFQQASGAIALNSGSATLQILTFDNGNPEVQLSFAPPDGEAQVVPPGVLTPGLIPYRAATDANGAFSIAGVPTTLGTLGASVTLVDGAGKTRSGRATARPPVPAGVTDLGQIRVAQASVLLLADADTPGTQALADALTRAGDTVTLRPPPEFTWDGTNPPLTDIDVVIHLNGATYSTPLPQAAQAALTEFVRHGGGFIASQWDGYERAQGRQFGMADLVLQLWQSGQSQNCGGCQVTYNTVAGQEGHPVLAGIPNTFTFQAEGHDAGDQVAFAVSPSVVLMRVPAGGPGVLVREFENGRVVNFSHAPNYNLTGATLQDPNIQQLYINAVEWTARK